MKMREIKSRILRELYRQYEAHGSGGSVGLEDLAKIVGTPENTVESAVDSFKESGLLDYTESLATPFDIHLTAAGIEEVEEPGSEAFALVQHVQQHVSVSGGHVQFGNNNTQNVTYSNVLESLKEQVNGAPRMTPETRMSLINAIDILQANEITSSKL